MDWILIPATLHIDPLVFAEYPIALQQRIRDMLPRYLTSKHNG
jgi:hypothetical protein